MLSRRFLCKVALPLMGLSYLFGTMQVFDTMNRSEYRRALCAYMDSVAWDGTETKRYLAESMYSYAYCSTYYPEPSRTNGDDDGYIPPDPGRIRIPGPGGSLGPTPVPVGSRFANSYEDVSIYDIYAEIDYHLPTGEKQPRTGTVAYVTVLTDCPGDEHAGVDNDYDPGAELYDSAAIIKHLCCQYTAEGRNEYPFTLYAFVHPDAAVCETPDGGNYDRVKLLQDLGYWVEIVGEAVTHDDIRDTKPYLSGHIVDDVGMRDLIRLRLWQLTAHPIVVMMDWNTLMMKPLNDIFDTLTNSDIPALYTRNGDNMGVNTGLMFIKPSNDEFEKMVDAYINTPYDPVSGWNNEGHNDFPGEMGMSGFLSYYFSKTDALEIDRCLYSNEFASSCDNTRFDDILVGRFTPNHCAAPYTCPDYDGEVDESCKNIHNTFFKNRLDFETNFWSKKQKTERVGEYHPEIFMGYCKGKGEENYLGMTKPVVKTEQTDDEKPAIEGECRSACARINDWETMCSNIACSACHECVDEPMTTQADAEPQETALTELQDQDNSEPEQRYLLRTPHGTYIRAHPGGEGSKVDLHEWQGSIDKMPWDLFRIIVLENGKFVFESPHGTYLRAHPGGDGSLVDLQVWQGSFDKMKWEQFTLVVIPTDGNPMYAFASAHGTFLRAHPGGTGSKLDLMAWKGSWDKMEGVAFSSSSATPKATPAEPQGADLSNPKNNPQQRYLLRTPHGTYIRAHPGGEGSKVDLHEWQGSIDKMPWDLFRIIVLGNGNFVFESPHGTYLRAHPGGDGSLVDLQVWQGSFDKMTWEQFSLVIIPTNGNPMYAFKSAHGTFLRSHPGGTGSKLDLMAWKGSWDKMEGVAYSVPAVEDDPAPTVLQADPNQRYLLRTPYHTYVRAHPGGAGSKVDLEEWQGSIDKMPWDLFRITVLDNGKFVFESPHGTYIRANPGGDGAKVDLNTLTDSLDNMPWAQFTLVVVPTGSGAMYAFKSAHGTYLRAHPGGTGSKLDLMAWKGSWDKMKGVAYAVPTPTQEVDDRQNNPEMFAEVPVELLSLHWLDDDPSHRYLLRSQHGTFVRAYRGGEASGVDLHEWQGSIDRMSWDLFRIIALDNGKFAFESPHGTYLRAHPGGDGARVDLQVWRGSFERMLWEQFTMVEIPTDGDPLYAFKSAHGTYLRAHPGGTRSKLDLMAWKGSWDKMEWVTFSFEGPNEPLPIDPPELQGFPPDGTTVSWLPDNREQRFLIRALQGGYIRAYPGGEGSQLDLQEWQGSIDKMSWDLFRIIELSNGRYVFESPHWTYLRAHPGGDGSLIDLQVFKGSYQKMTQEQFSLVEVPTESDPLYAFKSTYDTFLRVTGSKVDLMEWKGSWAMMEGQGIMFSIEGPHDPQVIASFESQDLIPSEPPGTNLTFVQNDPNHTYLLRTPYSTFVRAYPEGDGSKLDLQEWQGDIAKMSWDLFRIIGLQNGKYVFESPHGTYLRANKGGDGAEVDLQEMKKDGFFVMQGAQFSVVEVPTDGDPMYAFKSFYGTYLRAHPGVTGSHIDLMEWKGNWTEMEGVTFTFEGPNDPQVIASPESQNITLVPEGTTLTWLQDDPSHRYLLRTQYSTYVRAYPGGEGSQLDLQEAQGSIDQMSWDLFRIIALDNGRYVFESPHGTYLQARPGGDGANVALQIMKDSFDMMTWEQFTMVEVPTDGAPLYAFRSRHGTYLRAHPGGSESTLDLLTWKYSWDKMEGVMFSFEGPNEPQPIASYASQGLAPPEPEGTIVTWLKDDPEQRYLFRSLQGAYIQAHAGGQGSLVDLQEWQGSFNDMARGQFRIIALDNGKYAFESVYGTYLRAHPGGDGAMIDLNTWQGSFNKMMWEQFSLVEVPTDGDPMYAFKSAHATFLRAQQGGAGLKLDLMAWRGSWDKMQMVVFTIPPVTLEEDVVLGRTRDNISIFDAYVEAGKNSPNSRKEPHAGTVAYALVLTTCPEDKAPLVDNDHDPAAQFYDAGAIIKHAVIKSLAEGNAEYPLTLYAFIHPEATVCKRATGGTYDRVKMLQDLGYWVNVAEEAVTHEDLKDTQSYLSGNIFNDDVGIRDLIRLRLWLLTAHPIVVMMDWNALIKKPLNDIFESLTNSDIPAMYTRNGDDEGVSTGLMFIKPSNDEFEKMKGAFINTPYDAESGWNGEGHNNFPGKMGMSGFLSYYFSKTGAVEIDGCLYGNEFASSCENTRFDDVLVGRFAPNHCAVPWTCPDYDIEVDESCKNMHHMFFKDRLDFEINHWDKKQKTERVGGYNSKIFMGYCKGKGEENYLGMTDIKAMLPPVESLQNDAEGESNAAEGECAPTCGQSNDWEMMCKNQECSLCHECVDLQDKIHMGENMDPESQHQTTILYTYEYLPIRSVQNSNFCFEIPQSNTGNGNEILSWQCSGGDSQKFAMDESGYIRSKLNPNKCLNLKGPVATNGAPIQIWDCAKDYAPQKWTMTTSGEIRSQWDVSKCIDFQQTFSGNKVIVSSCNNGNNQKWYFETVKFPNVSFDNPQERYLIRTPHNTYVRAHPGGDGSKVDLEEWQGSFEDMKWEQFKIIVHNNGKYSFESVHGTYLRANPGGDGSKIDLQEWQGSFDKMPWAQFSVKEIATESYPKFAFKSAHGTLLRAHPGGAGSTFDLQTWQGSWEKMEWVTFSIAPVVTPIVTFSVPVAPPTSPPQEAVSNPLNQFGFMNPLDQMGFVSSTQETVSNPLDQMGFVSANP